MNRELIYVFPDYCSTGLWRASTGVNLEPSSLGISSGLQIALKYWHAHWELNLTDMDNLTSDSQTDLTYGQKRAFARWTVDGYELARRMTNESERYEFQFKE